MQAQLVSKGIDLSPARYDILYTVVIYTSPDDKIAAN
jgi:hypothetical protein